MTERGEGKFSKKGEPKPQKRFEGHGFPPINLTDQQNVRETILEVEITDRLERSVEAKMEPLPSGEWYLKIAGELDKGGVGFNDGTPATFDDLQKALDETPVEERRYPFTTGSPKSEE